MDFVPHTKDEEREMLEAIEVEDLDSLFADVPERFRLDAPIEVPDALSEPEVLRHLHDLAERNQGAHDLVCFAGGGAYDHHVPSAVRALATRSEFATSYTPYQPELSQGVLQAVYEFQTGICALYDMDVANASLYDGASALAEAINLAVRVTGKDRVVLADDVHPHYREVSETYASGLGLRLDRVGHGDDGTVSLEDVDVTDAAAVVTQYPNFFGRLGDPARAAAKAHEAGALAIMVTDPTAMGVLASPGSLGADVVVGEGHALGNPMSYGGPYVGLFATKIDHVRQVPGRIAGASVDADGRRAFVLTLQAREQHIRRAKATSNVCTNQTLMAIHAAVYLAWLGPDGLARLGELCIRRTAVAAARLAEVPGVTIAFDGPRFKEIVVETPVPAADLVAGLARSGYLVGPDLGRFYPDLSNHLLVAVTEQRTMTEIDGLAEAIEKELASR